MTTFNDFIKANQLEMNAVYTGPSDDDTQFDWIVRIKFVGKGKKDALKTDFRMGLAHCKFTPHWGDRDWNLQKGRYARTISQKETYGTVTPTKPDLETVLQCLQSDCMVDNYSDKWDFMDEFGYQGREGEEVYNACKSQLNKAKKFFGPLFNQFMELEEE